MTKFILSNDEQEPCVALRLQKYPDGVYLIGERLGEKQTLLSVNPDGFIRIHNGPFWKEWGFQTTKGSFIKTVKMPE